MERLSIDEVIEHCNRTCDMTERIAKARGHELESIESKQFWEHYQVREWLKELKQYKDAEEQGLLIRLPCKVRDTLYQKREDEMYEYKVIGVVYDIVIKEWMLETALQINGIRWRKDVFSMRCVGKTVFLTKAEAEQALKKEVLIEKAKDNLAEEIASLGLTDKADARDRIECLLKQMGE